MDIFSIFTLLGGLAFFLYGISIMSGGLEKIAGGRLEQLLKKMTSNPVKSFALGAFITAVIQSSSAVTVMLIGLVNSGIMTLSRTVTVIIGANLGTTITAWMLSLTAIQESAGFFFKLLKPETFAPVLAFIGVIMLMAAKTNKRKNVGTIFLGFAILMYGMTLMSGAMAPLADMPGFRNAMIAFTNPLFGFVIGMIITMIIQSSSASIGILQALSGTGAVNYAIALPIIMGQNIGTCATSIISSIGANKNARRTAMVHLYFNIIGTMIFIIGFYFINMFISFSFLEEVANSAGIALIHSLFNIGTTVLLFPFTDKIVKLAEVTVPSKDNGYSYLC